MRKVKNWRITGNAGDGGLLGTMKSLTGYTRFAVHTISGSVRFLPSLGPDLAPVFDAVPLVLSQEPVIVGSLPDATGSFLVDTNTDRFAWIEGDFSAFEVRQVGAGATDVIIRAGGDF